MSADKKVLRDKPIPEDKKETVKNLSDNIKNFKTVLIASCKNLPSRQFNEIKKNLRGKAEIRYVKKSSFLRAIDSIDKGALKNLKEVVNSDFVVFFSNSNPFELSKILSENQSPSKAKAGDLSPEEITIEPGPTELVPGPAISELSAVGLKVAVKNGKLEIKSGATVAKKGDEITSNVADVLAKLGITPMKVGFLPVAAYDSVEDKFYSDVKIDVEKTINDLNELANKALSFAIKVNYPVKETIAYFISKASSEEKIIENMQKIEEKEESVEKPAEEKIEEKEESVEKPAEERQVGEDLNNQNVKEGA
ncbi:50S ribosomal protein L10 [Candidatus Parvarchaeota archaeon]|nr:MAG: 50S ribosomal protein L10 [Candidatus Parvarchaeota archaeon]